MVPQGPGPRQAETCSSSSPDDCTLVVTDITPSDTRRSTPFPKPSIEELRSATRFRQEPKTAFAMIHSSAGENLRLEVFDESLFGICLVLADTRGLSVGDEVALNYASSAMNAMVKHVTPFKEGFYLVGLATRPVIDKDADL